MKKSIFLIVILGLGVYFLFQKEQIHFLKNSIKKIENKLIKTTKISESETIKEKEGPKRNYIGPDFGPIDIPTEGLPIVNKINPDFDEIVSAQFINPELPGTKVEVVREGSFILIKNGLGRYVEKISVEVSVPNASPHSFKAYADSDTGEILQNFENSEAPILEEDKNNSEEDTENLPISEDIMIEEI